MSVHDSIAYFFLVMSNNPLSGVPLSIHLHLGFFQVLAITNKAVVKIFFSTGSYGKSMLSFLLLLLF